MKNVIKVGEKVCVEGRFVPESKIEKVLDDRCGFGHTLTLDGTIISVDQNNKTCVVDCDLSENLLVPFDDISFRQQ